MGGLPASAGQNLPFAIFKNEKLYADDTDHQGKHDVGGGEGHDEDVGGAELLGPEQHDGHHHQVGEQTHHNWVAWHTCMTCIVLTCARFYAFFPSLNYICQSITIADLNPIVCSMRGKIGKPTNEKNKKSNRYVLGGQKYSIRFIWNRLHLG